MTGPARVWDGSAWVPLSGLVGPQGPPGNDGIVPNVAWTLWTPSVLYNSVAASVTTQSRWTRVGRTIFVRAAFKLISNSSFGTFTMTRPVPGAYGSLGNAYAEPLGNAAFMDISPVQIFVGLVFANTADGSDVHVRTTASPSAAWTNAVPATIANGDEVYLNYKYEALS